MSAGNQLPPAALPPTACTSNVRGCDIWTFGEDGKIVRKDSFWRFVRRDVPAELEDRVELIERARGS